MLLYFCILTLLKVIVMFQNLCLGLLLHVSFNCVEAVLWYARLLPDNWATTPVGYCPSTASFSVRPYCKNARRDRCQEYHNCFPFGELEKTTRTSLNYVDEDYPARPEINQSLTGWGDNCGSESSTLEIDVCVWCYAFLVVIATQEEKYFLCYCPCSPETNCHGDAGLWVSLGCEVVSNLCQATRCWHLLYDDSSVAC